MPLEPNFPVLDSPQPRSGHASYALPPKEWDRMAAFANFLAEKDAISPLKRRMRTYLEAANRASLIEQ
jgi:hypothetical protein